MRTNSHRADWVVAMKRQGVIKRSDKQIYGDSNRVALTQALPNGEVRLLIVDRLGLFHTARCKDAIDALLYTKRLLGKEAANGTWG